ncbi:MAG: hypothetical protein U5L07_00290 [Desulfobacterales bacterium]|nr:hypothetical protein [Desulfobacterales bacterium]
MKQWVFTISAIFVFFLSPSLWANEELFTPEQDPFGVNQSGVFSILPDDEVALFGGLGSEYAAAGIYQNMSPRLAFRNTEPVLKSATTGRLLNSERDQFFTVHINEGGLACYQRL